MRTNILIVNDQVDCLLQKSTSGIIIFAVKLKFTITMVRLGWAILTVHQGYT